MPQLQREAAGLINLKADHQLGEAPSIAKEQGPSQQAPDGQPCSGHLARRAAAA
jgi:hypothetical protein